MRYTTTTTRLYYQFERELLYHKNDKQGEYTPMPHPVEREANRDYDLRLDVEKEAAQDPLGFLELLYIDGVGVSRLPSF